MTQLPRRQPLPRRRTPLLVTAGVLAGTVLLAATVAIVLLLTAEPEPAPEPAQRAVAPTTGSAPTASSPGPDALANRVAVLMVRAGCQGTVIGTQLYARETGRCTLAGDVVTLATFDNARLRDQWIDAARAYGGNFAAGPGWAAMVGSPDTAVTVASRLGGQRV